MFVCECNPSCIVANRQVHLIAEDRHNSIVPPRWNHKQMSLTTAVSMLFSDYFLMTHSLTHTHRQTFPRQILTHHLTGEGTVMQNTNVAAFTSAVVQLVLVVVECIFFFVTSLLLFILYQQEFLLHVRQHCCKTKLNTHFYLKNLLNIIILSIIASCRIYKFVSLLPFL